jgi:PEP-CTERM motif
MNKSMWWPRSVVALTLAVWMASSAQAVVVLYRETFGRDPANGTGNIGTQNFDWGRWNLDGTLTSITSGVNGTDPGKPTDLANVNAGPYYQNATPGPYERGWSFLDGTSRIAMTPEYSFDPSTYPGGITFSWYQGNQVPGQDFKLAVRAGGSWYVSAATFQNAAVANGAAFNGGAEFKSLVYDPAAANWLTLNFTGTHDTSTHVSTASSAISVGAAPGANLSGAISGFGLYRIATGNNGRFDSFTIEANVTLGDTDGDGIGGEYPDDFNPIKDNFRKSPRTRPQGDLDGSGVVDFADFREWRTAHGASGASLDGIDFGSMFGAVPEPSTAVLALVGLVGLAARHRRS